MEGESLEDELREKGRIALMAEKDVAMAMESKRVSELREEWGD
jgi:hypothetical protein